MTDKNDSSRRQDPWSEPSPVASKDKKKSNHRQIGVLIGCGLLILLVGGLFGYMVAGPGAVDSAAKAAVEKGATIWTCSMHPQIKLPKPGKCPICGMDLIPLETDTDDDTGPRQLKLSERAVGLAEIQTTPVRREYATVELRMFGKVAYDETKVADITAWVGGRLQRLFVDYTGVAVRKGDHLVSLYSPDLIVAQRELLQSVKSRERPGNRDRELTVSMLKSSEEKLRLLGVLPEQIEEIKRRGTPSDYLTIYSPIGGIVIEKLANEGAYVETGTKIYTIADLSTVWVNLHAYESDLPWLRYGQQVEFTTESFPGEIFKGRIAFINPILDDKTRSVSVRVNVPNTDGKLKPGMFVSAVVRSRLAAGGVVFDPSLIGKWISPMHPEIVKDGPGKCDICGMDLVPAEELGYSVPKKAPRPPLVIPASAPLITGKRAVVYIRLRDTEKPTFEGIEVLLGARAGDQYVVRKGLKEGDLVVTKGAFKLDSSLQILARPSMMSPDDSTWAAYGKTDSSQGEKEKLAVPFAFRVLLDPIYESYLKTADALADNDLAAARKALAKLPDAVAEVDMASPDGPAMLDEKGKERWKQISNRAVFAAHEARDAKNLTQTRRHFGRLSQAMTELIGTFGHALPGRVYRLHCPMALDLRGSDWLQLGDEPRNPYFGPAMLRCGERVKAYESQAPLDVPGEFRRQLDTLYKKYFKLQVALADDQIEEAKAAFAELPAAIELPDAGELEGRTLEAWWAAQEKLGSAFHGDWQKIDIQGLRKRFESVSNAMLDIADGFGHAQDATLHRAFCPMALKNKGAAWLQAGETITNPYFGQKMLRCGKIQGDFPPLEAQPHGTAAEEARP